MIDKRHKAVAMRYNQNKEQAPRVTASGSGLTAQSIIEKRMNIMYPYKKTSL